MRTIGLLYLFTLTLASCKKEFTSESEFYKWWNDKDNGLVKEKTINEFKISVRFVPMEYLIYREKKISETGQVSDSITKKYKHSRTFLLTIEPIDSRKDVDLLFQEATSFTEYKDRVIQLNFHPQDFITLHTANNEYRPILSTMENAYNIDVKKTLYLVFAEEEENKELISSHEIDLKFDDQIFMTGINHFVFYKKDIDNIPEFNLNTRKS